MNNYTNPVKTKRQGYQAGTYYGADRNLDSNSCNCNGKSGNSIEMLFTEQELRDAGILGPNEPFDLSNLQYNTAFSQYMYNKMEGNPSNALGKIVKFLESGNTVYGLTFYAYEKVNSDNGIKVIGVEVSNGQLEFYDPYIVSVNGIKAGGNLDLKSTDDVEILTEGLDLIPYSLEEDEFDGKGGSKKDSDTGSGKLYNVEIMLHKPNTDYTTVWNITCGVRDDRKTLYYERPQLYETKIDTKAQEQPNPIDFSDAYVEYVRVTLDTYVECIAYFNGVQPNPDELSEGQIFVTPKQ